MVNIPSILHGLKADSYISPEDKAGLDKLNAIPGVKKFLIDTVSMFREKVFSIEMHGDGLNITSDSYPELYNILHTAAKTLNIEKIPDFSLRWSYEISIGSEGAANPRITALNGAIDLLEDEELLFLLGHELGHLAAGHKPFQNLLITLYTPLVNQVPHANIALALLRPLMLQWYRVSDYTADRAGLLACQNIDVALRTMIKMSGLPKKYFKNIKPETILSQAIEFERKNQDLASGIIQNLTINTACAPWLVVRAAKLYSWYKSGDYLEIINKHAR